MGTGLGHLPETDQQCRIQLLSDVAEFSCKRVRFPLTQKLAKRLAHLIPSVKGLLSLEFPQPIKETPAYFATLQTNFV